ncbi:DUF7524 family protein [Natrinema salinisoli]|uniref:DUF7524 family protein n=1 Tax=Natrinema salinisoli TaxID=2878535 RepID=UPI001CF058F9|nr:hypothetical protein [Natrinema salinisoli]
MPGTEVTVHVNRGTATPLEATSESLETSDSFALLLEGHETPAHVHCRLAGDLEQVATLGETNYYVEPDSVTAVPVTVTTDSLDRPVAGDLEVVTGYGSESVSIAVTAVPGTPNVDVDESLAEPARSEPDPTMLERLVGPVATAGGFDPGTLVVLALGLVAIGIATVTTATIGGPIATVGLGVVAGGVLVALVLLLR